MTLEIYRRLDNRFEGLTDDSPRALELHMRRKDALHDIFNNQNIFLVNDWGKTDDAVSHEFVTISISMLVSAIVNQITGKALKELSKRLAEKAFDEIISNGIKWVISKLAPKQKEGKILDYTIYIEGKPSIYVAPIDKSKIKIVIGTD